MNRMESKAVLRNIENKVKNVGQTDGLDAIGQKRRAAFTEVSNNENAIIGIKKTKCAKKQPLQQQVIQPVKQPLQQRQLKPAVRQQPAVRASDKTAVLCSKTENTRPVAVQNKKTSEVTVAEVAVAKELSLESVKTAERSDYGEETVDDAGSDNRLIEDKPASQVSTVVDAEMEDLCSRFEWIDVDQENRNSPYYVTEYIADIFEYYKIREPHFAVRDYISEVQNAALPGELSVQMRSILVDWLVEVQQNFELTHETLYFAVKMIDRYLIVEVVRKDRLQLVGATALGIACKYEERSPPILDDFLYVCDDAYNAQEFLDMEQQLLISLNFEIGSPISYTFLRRYAQCARVTIATLTFARYMTESSLVEYQYVQESESRIAAAALLLAMTINGEGSWDGTMVHYTGYVKSELSDLVRRLNTTISTPPSKTLATVHTKYSHEVFHQVATLAALSEDQLTRLFSS